MDRVGHDLPAEAAVGDRSVVAEGIDRSITDRFEARGLVDTPPAYPSGWFAVGFSRELAPGELLTRRFMDREIVVFRTRSGIARAAEAYCPHLGAHFGHGGSVQGEELCCPFHGFRFSVTGQCAYSPYGSPPPAARLGLLRLRELCGVLLVWYGRPGEPVWETELPADGPDWRRMLATTMRFHSHPQEFGENAVDIGHLRVLHASTGCGSSSPSRWKVHGCV